jgi:hypothetical protein
VFDPCRMIALFHDTKGEIRYIDKAAEVIVQGNRNGDSKERPRDLGQGGSPQRGDFPALVEARRSFSMAVAFDSNSLRWVSSIRSF